jgi:AraC-like DNA-binding protein
MAGKGARKAGISRPRVVCEHGAWWLVDQKTGERLHLDPLMRKCGWNSGELSALVGLSKRTFYRVIEESLGVPSKRWLREHRMVAARNLLRDGSKVLVVARQLGFRDECDFIREFKRWYEMPPGGFVQKERQNLKTRSA